MPSQRERQSDAPPRILICLGSCHGEFYLPLDMDDAIVCPNNRTHPVALYQNPGIHAGETIQPTSFPFPEEPEEVREIKRRLELVDALLPADHMKAELSAAWASASGWAERCRAAESEIDRLQEENARWRRELGLPT